MHVFMCDCCKTIEPKFRACTIMHPERDDTEVCIGCFDRIEGFIKSITKPFPEQPPEAP